MLVGGSTSTDSNVVYTATSTVSGKRSCGPNTAAGVVVFELVPCAARSRTCFSQPRDASQSLFSKLLTIICVGVLQKMVIAMQLTCSGRMVTISNDSHAALVHGISLTDCFL